MIVKKIPGLKTKGKAVTARAAHARHLIDYMRLPEKENPYREHLIAYMASEGLGDGATERLFHMGARNFVCDDIEGQRAEMMAVAQAAVRSPNPVDHWLISWREGEFPTPSQADEAVAMFVGHLGLGDHQCFYAVHGDTHNRHAHIAVNRYNPALGRVLEINDGFNLEAAHQAIALIVGRFGWQAEAEARYEVKDGKPVMAKSARERLIKGDRPIKPAAAAYEVRTGHRSAQRIAQEEALPIIRKVASWRELHAALAERGMTYDRVGTNGAIITVDGERVRSSNVHRSIVPMTLAKSLGPFEPRDSGIMIVPRDKDQDILPGAFRADDYRREREAWDRHRSAVKAKRERDRGASSTVQPASATGAISMLRGLLANRPVKKIESAAKPRKPAPDLESFYYDRNEVDLARMWRKRARQEPARLFVLAANIVAAPDQIDGYRPYRCLGGTGYARDNEGTAFIDRGDRVAVIANDDAALLAALKLAAIKSDGKVTVRGTDAFRRRVLEIARTNGLAQVLIDPDLSPQAKPAPPKSVAKGPQPQNRSTVPVLAAGERKSIAKGPSRMDPSPTSPRSHNGQER